MPTLAYRRRCVHVTNYSVNKHQPGFKANTDADGDGVGSKWSLRALQEHLERHCGVQWNRIWTQVGIHSLSALLLPACFLLGRESTLMPGVYSLSKTVAISVQKGSYTSNTGVTPCGPSLHQSCLPFPKALDAPSDPDLSFTCNVGEQGLAKASLGA